jgi:hypothetical protein
VIDIIPSSDNKFTLRLSDNNSKFGTLVLTQNTIALQPVNRTLYQIGRIIVSFEVKAKESQKFDIY